MRHKNGFSSALNSVGKRTSPFIWYQIITSLVGAFVCICVLIYLNLFYRKNYVKEEAKVLTQKCTQREEVKNSKTQTVYDCVTEVEFEHKNETYRKKLNCLGLLSNTDITGEEPEFDPVFVEFDPNNMKNIECEFKSKYVINIVVCIILVFSLLTAGFYYFFRRNSLVGVMAGFDTANDFIN